jgi:hypothetical protein
VDDNHMESLYEKLKEKSIKLHQPLHYYEKSDLNEYCRRLWHKTMRQCILEQLISIKFQTTDGEGEKRKDEVDVDVRQSDNFFLFKCRRSTKRKTEKNQTSI